MLINSASDLIWFLLPVAAYSGWYVARKQSPTQTNERESITPAYLQGLRYIINDQPDKAIEVFTKLLEADSETVEIHIALGNLFRRRGEVDRAIKIHQNLIARSSLTHEQRSQALLELAIDYYRAGLFDRAESLFTDLMDSSFKSRAAGYLVEIYQEEKDWKKAIRMLHSVEKDTNQNHDAQIAHYYCRMAEEAFAKDDLDGAANAVRQALQIDKHSAHGLILHGRIQIKQGDHKAALSTFKQLQKRSPAFLGEVLADIRDCHVALGSEDKYRAFLQKISDNQSSISQKLALSNQIKDAEGVEEATNYLLEQGNHTPSVQILQQILYMTADDLKGLNQEKLHKFVSIADELVKRKYAYLCHHCGYQAHKNYWQCPACKHWDTVKPNQE